MSLFDSDTGETNSVGYSADITAAFAQEPSLFGSVGNFVTKAIPLTGLSIVNSFLNTGISFANMFGANLEHVKVQDEMDAIGASSYTDYYASHQQGIEAAGLMIGSFIPGMAGVKAVRLMQAGKIGETAARATNLLLPATDKVINTSLQAIKTEGSLFNSLTADTTKAIALGFRDQAVQTLAFETATLATMNQSPLISGESWDNIAYDTAKGVVFGMGIGGILEGWSTYGKFRRALSTADNAAKAQEIFTNTGLLNKSMWDGNSLGADKALLIMNSLYDIPAPTTSLGTYKLGQTINKAENTFMETLLETFAANKDTEPFVRAFGQKLIEGRKNGLVREDLEDKLSRLVSVGPIDSDLSVPTADAFYIHTFLKGNASLAGRNPTIDELFTTAPHANLVPDVSRRYMMRPYAVDGPDIATFAQTFTHPVTGADVPLFKNAADAFAAGKDLFVNEKNQIIVNQRAPNIVQIPRAGENRILNQTETKLFDKTGQLPANSAPLTGANTYMNLANGDLSASAIAIPGDLGAVRVGSKDVTYGIGKKSVANTDAVSLPLTTETDTLTATSRYLWAADRGINIPQTIAEGDLPLLDAIYSQGVKFKAGWNAWINRLDRRGIEIEGLDELPSSPQDMLYHIMEKKSEFLADLINKNPAMGAEEQALRANVSKDYISNVFTATNPGEVVGDVGRFAVPATVKLQYNVGNALYASGNIIRGVVDTQRRMQLVNETARNTFAKLTPSYENFLADRFTSKDAAATVDTPGLISFSNAAYGSMLERFQGIGRMVQNWTRDRNTQDLALLSPFAAALRNNPQAAAEAGMITHIRRSTPYNYTLMDPAMVAVEFPQVVNQEGVMVLDRALVRNKQGVVVGYDRGFVPEGFLPGLPKSDIIDDLTADQRGIRTFYELRPEVSNMERAHMEINNRRNVDRNNWYQAVGLSTRLPMDVMYAPPIDVNKYPFVAMVRPKEGAAFADDGVSVIAAENAAALQQKILSIDADQFDVFTKDNIKKFREVQGDYDSQRNFNSGMANAEMRRKGVFNNLIPDVSPEIYLKDLQDWHSRQNTRLIRDYVEMGNAQLIAELRDMGDKFTSVATSRVNWWSALEAKTADNPYDKYIKIMLNIRDEPYKFWTDANEKLEAFADRAVRSVRNVFKAAGDGYLGVEETSKMAERMGLGNPYAAAVNALQMHTEIANQLPPGRALSRGISMINGIQSATAIRLDTMQTLINIVSNPIMTLTELASVRRAVAEVKVPGTNINIPSNFKLVAAAVKDWWDPAVRSQWLDSLTNAGIIQPDVKNYFRMQDEMSIPIGRGLSESAWMKKLEGATDMATTFTGSKWSENFVRFTTAMIGRRAFEAQGISGLELMDRISTFTSRVHGNYVAAQRPVAFQGPIGQAASLFQTYQLGMIQNLLRYVQNGEGKTLATFAGLQGTMFGIQGLPGIQMLNQYLIADAASNPAHKDMYSQMSNYMDKDLADWFLYGSVSNVLQMGLYSRGDINPRQFSIMPLNPLEFPAVSGGINLVKSIAQTASTLANGGAVFDTIMNGIEHNGMSRPLGGLAQLIKGYSTTSGGNLVQNLRYPGEDGTLGWADVRAAANFGRLLGARPLDEAVTLDANFRKTAYEANDQTKLKALGTAARTYLVANGSMPEDVINSFAAKYTAAGGTMNNFAKEIMDWQKSANVSIANDVFRHLGKPLNQQMMLQMGGMPLPDYSVPNPVKQQVPLTNTPVIQ